MFNLRGVPRFNMQIFNRWGQKIFETETLDKWWDGTFNNQPATEGAYVYVIHVWEKDGSEYTLPGTITLVR